MVQNCQLSVKQDNPRQYIAEIPMVRFQICMFGFKGLKTLFVNCNRGILDLGIGNDDLVVVHDARVWTLSFVPCGDKFLKENDFKHVKLLSADGALESYPPVRFLSFILVLMVSLPSCDLNR
ncbi:hypothetical protein EJB05_28966, partial [Eragrostis curvula]